MRCITLSIHLLKVALVAICLASLAVHVPLLVAFVSVRLVVNRINNIQVEAFVKHKLFGQNYAELNTAIKQLAILATVDTVVLFSLCCIYFKWMLFVALLRSLAIVFIIELRSNWFTFYVQTLIVWLILLLVLLITINRRTHVKKYYLDDCQVMYIAHRDDDGDENSDKMVRLIGITRIADE